MDFIIKSQLWQIEGALHHIRDKRNGESPETLRRDVKELADLQLQLVGLILQQAADAEGMFSR